MSFIILEICKVANYTYQGWYVHLHVADITVYLSVLSHVETMLYYYNSLNAVVMLAKYLFVILCMSADNCFHKRHTYKNNLKHIAHYI